jgi:hypothetical protein
MSSQTPAAERAPGVGDQQGESGERDQGLASRRPARRSVAVALVLGTLVVVGLVAAAGVGSAAIQPGAFQTDNETDETGPTVGNLTKINDTAVALEIVDDTDVDEATITVDDFLLDAGRIANVTAREEGRNATAIIELGAPLNRDELTVYVPADAGIADAAGNSLDENDDVSRTVGNMDGVPPLLMGYRVQPGADSGIDVRIETDDPVATLQLEVSGAESHQLGMSAFSTTDGGTTLETTVPVTTDGEYTVELVEFTDTHGNRDYLGREKSVRVDRAPPEAVATVDVAATTGRNYTFDASRSTDTSAIANVTWDFGDGEQARGERVTHRFEPGNYTVTARVTDALGNTGTDDVHVVIGGDDVNGSAANGANRSATVRLAAGGDGGASAMIQVADASAGRPVRIPTRSGRTVAETSTLTLDALSVTTARNASYRLGAGVTGPDPVADVEAATGGTAVAGVRLVHEVPDATVASANLTLTVNRSAIADAGGDPESVGLYRFHDDEWRALETTVLDSDNATVQYRAQSPGLSRFAVAVGGQATPAGETGTDEGTAGSEPGPSTTQSPSSEAGPTESAPGDGGLFGFLDVLPLGLLDGLVRYVGGVVVAAFLLLKSVALAMGY